MVGRRSCCYTTRILISKFIWFALLLFRLAQLLAWALLAFALVLFTRVPTFSENDGV